MIEDDALDVLDLKPRVVHRLQAAGLHRVGDLTTRSRADLLRLPGIGTTAVRAISEALQVHGLALKGYLRSPYRRPSVGDADAEVEALFWFPYLGARAAKHLRSVGVTTIGDLARMSADELREIPGLGDMKLASIRQALADLGFALRGERS